MIEERGENKTNILCGNIYLFGGADEISCKKIESIELAIAIRRCKINWSSCVEMIASLLLVNVGGVLLIFIHK